MTCLLVLKSLRFASALFRLILHQICVLLNRPLSYQKQMLYLSQYYCITIKELGNGRVQHQLQIRVYQNWSEFLNNYSEAYHCVSTGLNRREDVTVSPSPVRFGCVVCPVTSPPAGRGPRWRFPGQLDRSWAACPEGAEARPEVHIGKSGESAGYNRLN